MFIQEPLTSNPVREGEYSSDLKSQPLLRLRGGQPTAATGFSRRRRGALLMASIALASLVFRRLDYDNLPVVFFELIFNGLLLALVGRWSVTLAVMGVLLCPWLADVLGRMLAAGNGKEILMLGSLAWGAVASAAMGRSQRSVSLSVVCSGFLTLFVTFISDSMHASWFAYAWGVLCLWWLISNHWEEVQSQAALDVQPMRGYRLVSLLVGSLVFLVLTLSVANRVPVLRKLESGIMPTSGGSGQKDSVGRGLGNGDALVAARNHPSSFGAVDTDIFLESSKPSLFDVVSDELGTHRRVRRVERAQSLKGDQASKSAGRFSEANQTDGNQNFSTSRNAPKLRDKPDDLVAASLMFWSGRPDAHLAVERYSQFDGWTWVNPQSKTIESDSNDAVSQESSKRSNWLTPQTLWIDDQAWFYSSTSSFPHEQSPFVDAVAEAVKFTRFRSPVIPARAGLQMWSIDRLDRADFFGVDQNGLLLMPDRRHVPDYTVVRMVGSKVDLEKVDRILTEQVHRSSIRAKALIADSNLPEALNSKVAELARRLSDSQPKGWREISAVVSGMRQHFELDRAWVPMLDPEVSPPVQQVLDERRGPAYLIATTAALLLRELGYDTRLVVGFYANSDHKVAGSGDIAILPADAHVWVELHVGNGHWISLEPTQGYREEPMTAGLWYRIREARFWIATILGLGTLVITGGLVYRAIVLEIFCQLLWPVASLVSDRRRVAWLARLLDLRTRCAGHPRCCGSVLRDHFRHSMNKIPEELCKNWTQYLSASDRLCFGGGVTLSSEERQATRCIWRSLTVSRIRNAYSFTKVS